MRLFMPRRATPHRLKALFTRSSAVARVRFLPLTEWALFRRFGLFCAYVLEFFASAIQSTEATVSKAESVKTQNPSSDNSLRVGRRAALTNRARRAEALLAQKIRAALLAGSGGGATASGLTAAEENEFHAFRRSVQSMRAAFWQPARVFGAFATRCRLRRFRGCRAMVFRHAYLRQLN